MKRILITGKDSYIGSNFKKYLERYPDEYNVMELDVRDENWKNYDFTQFDVVFHVAGLAHSTPDESQRKLYYRVNTDLTYEVAKKAKESNIKHFIFMSSIIVYGSGRIGEDRIITKDTPLTPDNFYGDSKKQAELKIRPLEDRHFKIVIIRPPMIYGPKSKGNYLLLAKFAKKTPIFPTLDNKRSMLFLGNLMEFVKLMIDNEESGIFLPQNDEYVSSKKLIKEVAKIHQHRIIFIGIFNPLLKLLNKQVYINKVFSNLTISKELSTYKENYCRYSFKESIMLTEVDS
ncbi:NAD-dependent epimerase/dehydratase family protein [Beduini massiliensis]|uniref:NAD-dependent epimerase/dehydratase family protein n=1 Tax=Beduini massiliensis TaxID=1585974 RepID=UPI00059A8E2B|nr:NAD-dependent epimerase/dehydratase family protein [Beduini massiliensis]